MLSVEAFAKHLDTAFLSPALTEKEIVQQARIAREYQVASFYTMPVWTSVVARELAGSGVHVGAACSFPHGATTLNMKIQEMEEVVAQGATSIDLVANVGAIKGGDWQLVEREVKALRQKAGNNLAKLIIETCFLTDDELARVVQICSAEGIDYAKSGTNAQGKSVDHRVRVMLDNVSGNTRVKVSALPDTFMMSTILHLIDEGVGLFGTMYAADCIDEYRAYLAWCEARGQHQQ
ncbi:deoxyribose-phosphate aldolase [Collinsella sp. zg1085]|uniref:deoxyribose-phosphate aldolase n=1 Tax=Collinsella sp. zg1085 TaxID=2844380 RepID=UPI001C0CC051|nr:deoxyribose-phosphate aldolase [Collinsella sp. zg1085]QWT17484.1 deoxyribose-phosphate aldolase [Collinsella sp. zg1085]